jgi:hypothetical protein
MISVVVAARVDTSQTLPVTLAALVPPAIDGIVRQVIIVDDGTTDSAAKIADATGAEFVRGTGGPRSHLIEGAARARFPWLLFLQAGTGLEEGWERSATAFMRQVDTGERALAAAAFTLRLDGVGLAARIDERMARLRSLVCGACPEQGLLIPRSLFDTLRHDDDLAMPEDIDLVGRLGRRRLVVLDATATIPAECYRSRHMMKSARARLYRALRGSGLPANILARIGGKMGAAP